jgi:hypothetical protein
MTEQNANEHPSTDGAAGTAQKNHGADEHRHKEPSEVLLEQQTQILREEVEALKDEVERLEEELELVELELFSKENPGKKPPRAKKYRIRVDNVKIDMPIPDPTGRQILEAAGKVPPDRWLLNQKICGQMKPVGLDERVDLRAPGVERFVTLPKDQTEGRSAARRVFALPEEDTELLNAGQYDWETVESVWLLIHDFTLPPGFTVPSTSAAVNIPSGYPSGALDMVYFHPAIARIDGRVIPGTQALVPIDGKQWQRWSRHYTAANPWHPGEYNVVTHLNLARTWVEAAAAK